MSSVYSHILEMKEAAFSYSGEPFIRGLSLTAGQGEFIGLLGANGSGKSTVLKLLAGILRPDRGEVELWGKPISSYRNRDRAKLVSYLPQMLDMGVPFRVGELAGMGLYPYDRVTGLGVEEALELVGLDRMKRAPLTRISGGERRRAYIAMTLIQGAGVLLLDEPMANLDIRYQVELLRLLRRLNAERNITIVMALHDVNLAFGFERLVLIKDGRLLAQGPSRDVLSRDALREAFEMDVDVRRDGDVPYITYGDSL